MGKSVKRPKRVFNKTGAKKADAQGLRKTKALGLKTISKSNQKVKAKANKNETQANPQVNSDYLRLNESIWPLETQVLFRPDRLKYVRRLVQPKGCVFCDCQNEEPSFANLVVFTEGNASVVLNKYPYNSGHLLVIPHRHVGALEDLSEGEFAELMRLLRKTVQVIKKEYGCAGLNVGLNLGAVAGAGIPEHLHIHVIPRWSGDLNFFPLIAQTKVVVESLEDSYHRVRTAFLRSV